MNLLRAAAASAAVFAARGCHGPDGSEIAAHRALTPSGSEARWSQDEVLLEPVASSPDAGVTTEELVEALQSETKAWNDATHGCAGVPRLRVAPVRAHGSARTDGHDVVVVLDARWCPADRREIDPCYRPDEQAITSLRDGTAGAVNEADIEINAVDFKWSLEGTGEGTRSLRGVVAHELGHVLGLAHSCSPRPSSNDGGGSTECHVASAARSIMYPDPTEPGRPYVLEPDADSVAALCGGVRRGARWLPW